MQHVLWLIPLFSAKMRQELWSPSIRNVPPIVCDVSVPLPITSHCVRKGDGTNKTCQHFIISILDNDKLSRGGTRHKKCVYGNENGYEAKSAAAAAAFWNKWIIFPISRCPVFEWIYERDADGQKEWWKSRCLMGINHLPIANQLEQIGLMWQCVCARVVVVIYNFFRWFNGSICCFAILGHRRTSFLSK